MMRQYLIGHPGKLWGFLVAVSGALLFIHLIAQALSDPTVIHSLPEQLINRVDMDDEQSLPTWFSVILLFSASLFSFSLAFSETRQRITWSIFGVLFLTLSIDEEITFHETTLQFLHNFTSNASFFTQSAWFFLAPVIFVFGFILSVFFITQLHRKTITLLLIGGGIYVSGFMGVEILSSNIEIWRYLYRGFFVGLEETLELIGIITIFTALLHEARQQKTTP